MRLDYCVFGTNNMEDSTKFYDSLFEHTELTIALTLCVVAQTLCRKEGLKNSSYSA